MLKTNKKQKIQLNVIKKYISCKNSKLNKKHNLRLTNLFFFLIKLKKPEFTNIVFVFQCCIVDSTSQKQFFKNR